MDWSFRISGSQGAGAKCWRISVWGLGLRGLGLKGVSVQA